jgi:predicted PilT family ATPase
LFVKTFKEGKQQAFDDRIEIMAFDSRQALEIAGAIKYIAGNGKPKDKVWSDKQSVIKFISENVGGIKSEGKEIKQKIELTNNDPCRISLTVSSIDEKGKTTDEIYEFTLTDMNKLMVDLKVSGKNVVITIPCKNKEKLVKVYKNGEQQAWGTEAKIEAADVETARNIAEAFRSAITQCEK